MEIAIAGVAFVVLFAGWVVAPTMIKKHHAVKADNAENSEHLGR